LYGAEDVPEDWTTASLNAPLTMNATKCQARPRRLERDRFAMLIVCKTCASSYHIPSEILGENGCRLRCVGCGDDWAVTPGPAGLADAPIVEGVRIAPEAHPHWKWSRSDLALRPTANGGDAKAEKAPGPRFRLLPRARQARAALAGALITGCAMAAIGERAIVVAALPPTARLFAAIGLPVNLRGLALDNVRTNIFDLGDKKMLIIEGSVENLRSSSVEAPNMRIALRGADKRELYVWTAPAPKARLEANEKVAFRTRLAAPPDGIGDVLVKFAAAGAKISPVGNGS
jgi:predicted Zn finger-like uncharacterized protein